MMPLFYPTVQDTRVLNFPTPAVDVTYKTFFAQNALQGIIFRVPQGVLIEVLGFYAQDHGGHGANILYPALIFNGTDGAIAETVWQSIAANLSFNISAFAGADVNSYTVPASVMAQTASLPSFPLQPGFSLYFNVGDAAQTMDYALYYYEYAKVR